MATGERGLGEAVHDRIPALARVAADGDRPRVAVVWLDAEVEVALDRTEPREPRLPAVAVDMLGPLVVVLGLAAEGDGAVRDRGAADDPPARHVDEPGRGAGLGEEAPVVGLADDAVGVGELRRPRVRPVMGPGLDQHDLEAGHLAEARRQDAAGRAGAGDDDPHATRPRAARRRPPAPAR